MKTEHVVGWLLVAVGVIGLVLLLLGCAPVSTRLTSETLWPGEPALIVVEWPRGETAREEIEVHDVDGRLQIVGPYRPETAY